MIGKNENTEEVVMQKIVDELKEKPTANPDSRGSPNTEPHLKLDHETSMIQKAISIKIMNPNPKEYHKRKAKTTYKQRE